jgi:hypothetical protein
MSTYSQGAEEQSIFLAFFSRKEIGCRYLFGLTAKREKGKGTALFVFFVE